MLVDQIIQLQSKLEAYSKTNWENTKNSDADAARFNSTTDNDVAQSKTLKSFDKYWQARKKTRRKTKKAEEIRVIKEKN